MAAQPTASLVARLTLHAPDGAVAAAELHRIGLRAAAHTAPAGTPWLRLVSPLPFGSPADDGARSFTIRVAGGDDMTGIAVFDAGDGLVEFVLGEDLTVPGDVTFELSEFAEHRRSTGDPFFAHVAESERQRYAYWCYEAWETARDGSCAALVTDSAKSQAIIVIDRDGELVDGLWVDPLLGATADLAWVGELTRFQQRRAAAGDPLFAKHLTVA